MTHTTPAAHIAEPWLRATYREIAPPERAVIHALELAHEDLAKWCFGLDRDALNQRPLGLPSVAFQLRHIARSLDRFVTYAGGSQLTDLQRAALAGELDSDADPEEVFAELDRSFQATRAWLLATEGEPLDRHIGIGRKALPTTRAGLLVHMAEHTQRHVGQAVTTAKVLAALPSSTND
jgi:uncharacterized damage-inducible protein DinB